MLDALYAKFDERVQPILKNIRQELGVNVERKIVARELLYQTLTDFASRRFDPELISQIAKRQFRNRGQFCDLIDQIEGGIVFAVPHFGPFMWACVGASAWFRERRPLAIFFQNPEDNRGNATIFETLSRFFRAEEICFDDRRGLAHAARTLQKGGLAILMPDAIRSRENSFLVPFLSGEYEVQPGTAALARMTSSTIVTAFVRRTGFLSYCIDATALAVPPDGGSEPAMQDYATMESLMRHFSNYIEKYPVGWRYWSDFEERVLLRGEGKFEQLPLEAWLLKAEQMSRFA